MELVPYEDTEWLTPYEEGVQRLIRRVEALEADLASVLLAWFGAEQAKCDTNAAVGRINRRLDALETQMVVNHGRYIARLQRLEELTTAQAAAACHGRRRLEERLLTLEYRQRLAE